MIAPYLKIQGQDVEIGQVYYTLDLSKLTIAKNKASHENNVSYLLYFFSEQEALIYKNSLKLFKELEAYLKELKSLQKHLE